MRTAHVSRNASRSVTSSGDQIIVLSTPAFKSIRTAVEHGKGTLQDHEGLDNAMTVEALAAFGIEDAWPGSDRLYKEVMEKQRGSKEQVGTPVSINVDQREALEALFESSDPAPRTITFSVIDGSLCIDGKILADDGQWTPLASSMVEQEA